MHGALRRLHPPRAHMRHQSARAACAAAPQQRLQHQVEERQVRRALHLREPECGAVASVVFRRARPATRL